MPVRASAVVRLGRGSALSRSPPRSRLRFPGFVPFMVSLSGAGSCATLAACFRGELGISGEASLVRRDALAALATCGRCKHSVLGEAAGLGRHAATALAG